MYWTFFYYRKIFEGCIATSTISDSEYLTCKEVRKRKLYVTPYSVGTVGRRHVCRELYGKTSREGEMGIIDFYGVIHIKYQREPGITHSMRSILCNCISKIKMSFSIASTPKIMTYICYIEKL